MEITPDFSEAVADTGASVPDGTYKVRVVEVEMKDSKAGNKYLNWKLEIFGAEGEVARFNNWKIYHRTMLAGKGAGMLKSFVKAATGTDVTGSFSTDTIIGKELQVTVKTGLDQNGEPSRYPEVKAVKAIV